MNVNDGNLDNHNGAIAQSNSILSSLQINQNYNNMIVYKNEDGGNSWYFKCNRKETITSLCGSVRDLYYQLIPNFPDSHLVLELSKKLKHDKYVSILEKMLVYMNKISLTISYYLGFNLYFCSYSI